VAEEKRNDAIRASIRCLERDIRWLRAVSAAGVASWHH
jgi:hypothetical protein